MSRSGASHFGFGKIFVNGINDTAIIEGRMGWTRVVVVVVAAARTQVCFFTQPTSTGISRVLADRQSHEFSTYVPRDVISTFGMLLFLAIHDDRVRFYSTIFAGDNGTVAQSFAGQNPL